MKQGRSLPEVLTELQRQDAAKVSSGMKYTLTSVRTSATAATSSMSIILVVSQQSVFN